MKNLRLPLLATASLLIPMAHAADITWSGATSNVFNLGTNWAGSTAPQDSLTADAAIFGSTVTTNKPRLGDAARSITGLTFQTSGWTFDSTAASNTLSLGAGGIAISGGSGTINSPAVTTIGSATAGNNFNLSLASNSAWSVTTGNNLELYSALQGSGNLSLSGGGEVGLRGVNSAYSGNLSVSNGTLRVRTASSLGDTVGTTTVSGTGTLRFSTSGTYNENLVLSGAGTAGGNPAPANGFASHGAIYYNVSGAGTTLGGTITLAGATTINNANTGIISLNGVISGGHNLTFIDGDNAAISQINLGGDNTYTGATLIDDVRIQIQHANALATSSGVTLTDKDGSRLDVNSFTISIKALSGGGASGGNVLLATGSLHAGSGNTDTAYSGVISGSGNFNKQGSGTLTLAGASTYTGTTHISGGTLALGASERLADSSNLVLNGGTLAVGAFTETLGVLDLNADSSITLGSGGTLVFLDSHLADWSAFTLSIIGSFVDGSSIRFGNSSTALDPSQLALISINGQGAAIDTNGFLSAVAIPEPSAFAALAGLGALGGALARRRRAQT